ncbi:hypothetical protein ES707_10279 [subsurface metagenome]
MGSERDMESLYRPFTALGLVLIACGLILVALPFVIRSMPSLEKVPWIILWVYRRDGFFFATSPLLIMISAVSLLISLYGRR